MCYINKFDFDLTEKQETGHADAQNNVWEAERLNLCVVVNTVATDLWYHCSMI